MKGRLLRTKNRDCFAVFSVREPRLEPIDGAIVLCVLQQVSRKDYVRPCSRA